MSGTLAFLFAYLWLRGVLSPQLHIGLHRYVIWVTVIWQTFVFSGLMGRAGQPAHPAIQHDNLRDEEFLGKRGGKVET